MATITHTDYVFQQGTGGVVNLVPGVWVRLRNNSTGTDYYSTAVTDATSAFTHSAVPGDYSLYTGSAATVLGTPTLRNAHYAVPVTAGDDIVGGSASIVSSGPYAKEAGLPDGWQGISGQVKIGLIPTGADQTVALQADINAFGVTGGGEYRLRAGVYIVDFATGTVVGSGGTMLNCCLSIPSNVWLRGAGIGVTIIRVKAVTRTPNVTGRSQSILINQHPDVTTDTNIFFSDLTIDGNRSSQGPYAFQNISLAVTAYFSYRGLCYFGGTQFGADNLEIKNMPDFALFLEANCSTLTFGRIQTENCVAGFSVDQATNGTVTAVMALNSDATFTINTTSTTTVVGGAVRTITPVSMAGIAVNSVLALALGTSVWENVLVTAVTGTTFDAYVAFNHGPGSYAINDAKFASDGAVQANLLTKRFTFAAIDVDYTGALCVIGPGIEISGAQGVSVGLLVARGTFRAIWLHSWNIGATHYIPTDIVITAYVAENCVSSASGVNCSALFIDDHALSAGADLIKDITIASMVVRFGKDGAAIPGGSIGVQIRPNVTNVNIGVGEIDGAYWGLSLEGCSGNMINTRITNTQQYGAVLQAAAARNRLDLTIDTTGIANAAAGQGVMFLDNTVISNNVVNLLATNIPGASAAIDLSASTTGVNNSFFGDVSTNAFPVKMGNVKNSFYLVGGPLTRSRQTPTEAVLVSGVDATVGELIGVTITAARVVGAPLNPSIGQRLTFNLVEGGAGAFAITWNAVFKGITGGTSGATGTRASFSFDYDGTNWNLNGAQPTWVA